MPTIPSLIRIDVVTACRDPAVAAAAGLGASAWADTTVPHVFDALQGYMGGRNRGRLPFLEVAVGEMNFDTHNTEGGTVESTVTVRCHVGAKDQVTAMDQTAAILLTCLQRIRDKNSVTYLTDGGETLDALVAGPWGLMRDLRFTIRHVFERPTFGVQ